MANKAWSEVVTIKIIVPIQQKAERGNFFEYDLSHLTISYQAEDTDPVRPIALDVFIHNLMYQIDRLDKEVDLLKNSPRNWL